MADYGLLPSSLGYLRLAHVPDDRHNAGEYPLAGWPPYHVTCGQQPPAPPNRPDFKIETLRGIDPSNTYNR